MHPYNWISWKNAHTLKVFMKYYLKFFLISEIPRELSASWGHKKICLIFGWFLAAFLGIYEHKRTCTMCPESLTRCESNFYLSHTNYRYFLNTHNKIEKKGWSNGEEKEIPFSNNVHNFTTQICQYLYVNNIFFGILCKEIEPGGSQVKKKCPKKIPKSFESA